ncbi:MAG: exodeoxyribonuclease V subunit gamma [Deltaproteobacteria bacterium]|nr:exodeoxyribonuclease V subunit gamma [Deltaproteobacteria bacterium]
MSNRLDSFVDQYYKIINSNSLFKEKVYIVVQNKSIGEWLKLEIASRCGVSANLNIMLPENAVRTFIHSFNLGRTALADQSGNGEKAVLFMDNLKIIIYKKLEEILQTDSRKMNTTDPVYQSLENYVKGLSSKENDFETINSLRLYQLSDSIAGLFYYYGMNCRELTSNWEKGYSFFPSEADIAIKDHEKWQMALWNELFKEDSPYVHLSSILSSIVDNKDIYDGESCRIILFGSTFMGDSSLRFFNHLSIFIDIEHFILSPCSNSETLKMNLLSRWGSLFGGFNNLISSSSFYCRKQDKKSFVPNNRNTVLAELQNRILNNDNSEYIFIADDYDESIKIISTTGKWREVEALKNRILRLLDSDNNLKLTDIGILAPDINEYANYIEALFPSTESVNLPFNIIDLKGDEDSPFIRAFLALLNLAGARFTREELFSLFSNRCFAEKNSISSAEYDLWLDLCSSVNIKWAVDEVHKKEMNVKGGRYNSWQSGFDRILEGIALSEDEIPYSAPYELFNESSNLSAGKLFHIIHSLNMDINSLQGVKLQLEEWVLIWESIMDTYLKPSGNFPIDQNDRLRLKGCFRDILNMINDLNNLDTVENRQFDFYMFKSLLTEFISKSGGSRGRYLTQGISCSSLKPLRAVPFKVIMVLGMNEDSFPAVEDPLSFDLKENTYVKEIISIDLSRSNSDKYSFLEVFLSAREKVFLFYTGRSNTDNEILQPSSVINELAEYLNNHYKTSEGGNYFQSIVEYEKLQPFDKDYFSPDSSLFSYNREDFDLAGIYYNQDKASGGKEPYEAIPLNCDDSFISLTISDLNKFLINPVKYYFNSTVSVYMDEQILKEEDISENIELDFFEKRSFFKDLILSESLDEKLLNDLPQIIESYCLLQNKRGELIDNELSIPEIERLSDTAGQIVSNLISDNVLSSKPEPTVFTFGDSDDFEKRIIKSPEFLADGDKKITVSGSLPPIYIYPDKKIVYLDIVSKSSPDVKHWITPYLVHNLLPEKMKNEKGLKAFLVSPKEIFTLDFPETDSTSFGNMLECYLKNLEKPVPLYPEVAELLVDRKDPARELTIEFLSKNGSEKWQQIEGADFGYSEFRDCPYRLKVFKQFPEKNCQEIKDLYDSFFKGLFMTIYEEREK